MNEASRISYRVFYQKGKQNRTDYLSKNAKHISKLSHAEQTEAEDLQKLLYILHTTPIMDHITLAAIAKATAEDPTLGILQNLIREGKTWIPKGFDIKIQKFILHEMIAGNGIILKGDRG